MDREAWLAAVHGQRKLRTPHPRSASTEAGSPSPPNSSSPQTVMILAFLVDFSMKKHGAAGAGLTLEAWSGLCLAPGCPDTH